MHFEHVTSGPPAGLVERASTEIVFKPWGSDNLLPWHNAGVNRELVGEMWFRREHRSAHTPSLLLKILFTEQRLSVQVHPDDAYAISIGLPNGKSEAWYVLSARPGSKVALGLKRKTSAQDLRSAVAEGSLPDLIQWHDVVAGDVIDVPAGTIHAIGPGLVIAEIQQNSDATYRLFDFGRERSLHVDDALEVAHRGPTALQSPPILMGKSRTILLATPHFILERLNLEPNTSWLLRAPLETWLMPIAGRASLATIRLDIGEAAYADGGNVELTAGEDGASLLVAYVGPNPTQVLLEPINLHEAAL